MAVLPFININLNLIAWKSSPGWAVALATGGEALVPILGNSATVTPLLLAVKVDIPTAVESPPNVSIKVEL